MRFAKKVLVSVDCIYVRDNVKVNFIEVVDGFNYHHQDFKKTRKGQEIADNLARIRARKQIDSLPSYKVISTRIIPSTTLEWKNNDK